MLKEKILQRLEELGVNEELISKSLVSVIQGVTVKQKYKHGTLVEEQFITNPVDMLRGLLVFDIISGGKVGIANENLISRNDRDPSKLLDRERSLPGGTIDLDIISNKELIDEHGSK